MKLILRVLGTWMFGLALILLIVDIVRSFSAQSIEITSLAGQWAGLNEQSWQSALAAMSEATEALGGAAFVETVFSIPVWVAIAILGLVFQFLGRRRRGPSYIARP